MNDDVFQKLRQVTQGMTGKIPSSQLSWAEAVRIRLEYRLGQLWLLLEPTIWVEHTDDDNLYTQGREFIRSRLAGRFNRAWNQIIDAWADVIVNGAKQCELRAFGVSDGVDAAFSISRITGFSRREVTR